MEIKASELTGGLVIGLIIVTIAKIFYSPLHMTDLMEGLYNDMEMPSFILNGIIFFFMPIMATMAEVMSYVTELFMALGYKPSRAFASVFLGVSYFIVLYLLEKVHSDIHREEGVFSICVDMICIENISMYLYSVIMYHITQLIIKIPDDNAVMLILLIPMIIFALFCLIIYFTYFLVGVIICAGPSIACIFLLQYRISEVLLSILILVLMVVFSQIVWRMVSDKVLNVILKKVTFDHLSLD